MSAGPLAPRTPARAWRPWLVLAAILACAAALRLCGLDRSLSLLEINTWWYGQMPLRFIIRHADYFPHIYALAHLAGAPGGGGETWLRLPFALYGVLTVPWVFLLGRRLFDEETGLWAAGLTAISVCHIRFSQEARYYPLLAFYALAAFYCLLGALDSRGRRRLAFLAGFILAHALNFHVHIFALYPFALCLLILAVRSVELRWKKEASAARETLLFGGGAAVLALLCLAGTWERVWFFLWSQLSSDRSMLDTAALRIHNRGDLFRQFFVGFSGSGALGSLFLSAGAAGMLLRGRASLRAYCYLGLWLVAPLLSLAVIRAHYHFEPWYFIFDLPILLLLAASGIGPAASLLGARGSAPRVLSLVAVAGLVLGLTRDPFRAHFSGAPEVWREGIGRINRDCLPGDAVFFHPAWGRDGATRYYPLKEGCRGYEISYLTADGGVAAPEVFSRHERLWLALAGNPDLADAREAGAVRALLERYYREEGVSGSGSLGIRSYRRNGVPLPAARVPAAGRPVHDGPLPFRFLGNLDESPDAAPVWRSAFAEEGAGALSPRGRETLLRYLSPAELGAARIGWRRISAGEWEPRAPAGSRAGRTLGVVLAGRVRFQGATRGAVGASFFREGDVFITGRRAWPPNRFRGLGAEDLRLLLVGLEN